MIQKVGEIQTVPSEAYARWIPNSRHVGSSLLKNKEDAYWDPMETTFRLDLSRYITTYPAGQRESPTGYNTVHSYEANINLCTQHMHVLTFQRLYSCNVNHPAVTVCNRINAVRKDTILYNTDSSAYLLTPRSSFLLGKLILSKTATIIPSLLWTLKAHYYVHKSPPLVPDLSHSHWAVVPPYV